MSDDRRDREDAEDRGDGRGGHGGHDGHGGPDGHAGPDGHGGRPGSDAVPAERKPPGPNPGDLRASDADRDRVAERLRDAVAEGRLDMDEFEERLEAAYTSRTYAELEPLTRDLPAPVAVPAASGAGAGTGVGTWPGRIGGPGTSSAAVAVMSGFQRVGQWTVPARFDAVAFWGGGKIDLREALFSEREVVINCFAVMGGIDIVVPPGVELDVRGFGLMGAFDRKGFPGPTEPGAPRVVVTGFAFWGGVQVKVKPPKTPKPPKQAKLPPGPPPTGPSLRKDL
ncbi:DUF1707 domain-containing protein [Streptomyces sp. NPDC089799]|uniref:DUF1707 SHOCT-like domain-containing protein n=1 Tax=Streptomyces sp. NPDC089799 TaxID=3155066 RepID=UPI003420B797